MSVYDKTESLKGDKKIPLPILFKRLWYYIKPEIWWFVFAFLFIIVNVVIEAIMPQFISMIVDKLEFVEDLIETGDSPAVNNLYYIIIVAIGYLVLSVVSFIFYYIQGIILQRSGQRIIYKLRMEVFEHIESMSQNQLNDMPVGSLVTRVTNYTTSMSDLFTNVLVNLLKNILMVVVVFIMMMILSWYLALVQVGFLAAVFLISYIFRVIVYRIFKKERQYVSEMNAFVNENLSGMKITQIFNQQKRKENEFLVKNENLRKTRYQVVLAFGLYRPLLTILYYGAIVTTFVLGMQSEMTAAVAVAFYLYVSRFFNPVQSIADQLNAIQKANSASERLFNLLDIDPQVLDRPDAIEVDHFEGKIEFRNVWFAYEKDNWILKDVSFVIQPKQTVAFVGATGAGKTTILGLIVRNFEIQKGQILIDDIDIRDIKIKSLRKKIGQMLQDVFLFSGTMRNNITLHDESYTDEQVMQACRYVNADSFINKSEKGLDEIVIERGENFSQGQRQLISFARTVLSEPQILVLDEATANIDTETEVLIQESLEKMKNIGTMLIVAHRLSTIQKADQIIVLQHGEVIENGNHQSLLKQKGFYYKLYKLQFADN